MPHDHDAYAALRNRDYRLLLAGGILSTTGGEVLAVAVSWEVYQRTGSAAALGFTGLAQFLPVLILALPAGQVADHFSRKRIVQAAQTTFALSAVGLAILSLVEGPIALVYLCLVVIGCSRAFAMPARGSLLPLIVPSEQLANAVAWSTSGFQIANVVGPALGGLMIAGLGGIAAGVYLLAAGCLLTCVLMYIPIRPRAPARSAEPRSLASLFAGVRFVWRTDLMLAAITLDLFAVLLGGATALLAIFAEDILHVGPVGFGWLRASPAIGALLMGVVMAHRPPLKQAGRTLLVVVAGFGAATIVFGLSRNFWLSFAMLALTGALDNVSVVIRHTLMQMLTPDDMRGRVAAVNAVFISSSNELGAFESGVTAHWFGPVLSVVGGGIGTILVVLAVTFRWPRLLRLGTLHSALPVTSSEPPEKPS